MPSPSRHRQFITCVGLFCAICASLLLAPKMTPFVYAANPPYPVKIEHITLAAPSGQPLNDCRSVGQGLAMIAVTLKNLSSSGQPSAAVVVELEDRVSGSTQFVQWQTMSISPNAEQQAAISFNPSSLPSTGQYYARVLIWNEVLPAPVPLGDPSTVPINC